MRIRILAAVGVLTAVQIACGPAPPASAPRTTTGGRSAVIRTEVNNGPGYEFLVARTESGFVLTLPASMEAAWEAVIGAYAELKIPLTHTDRAARELGNRALPLRARFAGQPLSMFLECGRILGGSITNTYRVNLTVNSVLEAADTAGTRLVTRISATASDPASSNSGASCTSTGELERRIGALAAVRLGKR